MDKRRVLRFAGNVRIYEMRTSFTQFFSATFLKKMSVRLSVIDMLIIVSAILGSVGIGFFFSGRQKSMSTFFLGSKGMSGWLLGFSMTATMISAMTFLATPGFAFKKDYLYFYPSLAMILTGFVAMYYFVPLFRKVTAPSGYEYLEKRFGVWARVYAAVGFLLFNILRSGVVLYATSLALSVVLGYDIVAIMLALGILATLYTMAGGFEAVIWSEMLQVVLLFVGAAVLVPTALNLIDGGAATVWKMGAPAGKFGAGSLEWSFTEATLWVMLISNLFSTLAEYSTRQDFIQRYRAAKSLGHARLAILVGALTIIPTWGYFHFLGTSLWAYYEINPDPAVTAMLDKPEGIVPYFVATQIPNGFRGLVMGAILMATLSTLAPLLNALAVTWMDDFHKRFINRKAADRHYLLLSRLTTALFGVGMIGVGVMFHSWRSGTLQDFNYILALVVSAGMMGLFFIGFFGRWVSGKAAGTAMALTVSLMALWLVADSAMFKKAYPAVAPYVPNLLWTCVLTNTFFMVSAGLLGWVFPKPSNDLSDVTWHGLREKVRAAEAAERARERARQ